MLNPYCTPRERERVWDDRHGEADGHAKVGRWCGGGELWRVGGRKERREKWEKEVNVEVAQSKTGRWTNVPAFGDDRFSLSLPQSKIKNRRLRGSQIIEFASGWTGPAHSFWADIEILVHSVVMALPLCVKLRKTWGKQRCMSGWILLWHVCLLQQCATKRKMSFCPQGWPLFSLSFFELQGFGRWHNVFALIPLTRITPVWHGGRCFVLNCNAFFSSWCGFVALKLI